MSDFSLTLVLQIKTSKIINDMAKVQQKSEKITAFGGIFFVLDRFDRILSSVIDSHLGLRSKLIGYQYSEIIRAVFSVFCCGGDCMEDLNLYLKDVLSERPHTRVPSADTVLRGIEELATENISYTAEKTGNVYDFNTAEKLNQLLIKLLLATGQLTEGSEYDVQSFPFESFEDVKHCRLVVQRQRKQKGEQLDLFDGEYTYRCILTNDWDMTDEEIIQHYNKRETAEQVFDRQNNDFGWAHLPKSFMNQNTVFLLITAMAANFYRYIVALPLMAVLFGIKATDRVKNFLFRFIAVPAKWIKTARQYRLNIYSEKPYDLIWEHG